MSRRAARVTQADIARARRAVEKTGTHMAVEVAPDGTIRIIPFERHLPTGTPQLGQLEPRRKIVL